MYRARIWCGFAVVLVLAVAAPHAQRGGGPTPAPPPTPLATPVAKPDAPQPAGRRGLGQRVVVGCRPIERGGEQEGGQDDGADADHDFFFFVNDSGLRFGFTLNWLTVHSSVGLPSTL